jgi:hypothetical protein
MYKFSVGNIVFEKDDTILLEFYVGGGRLYWTNTNEN